MVQVKTIGVLVSIDAVMFGFQNCSFSSNCLSIQTESSNEGLKKIIKESRKLTVYHKYLLKLIFIGIRNHLYIDEARDFNSASK